jgi:adenosyl cobinamide kinase/adenosyl cobinamide phosphate guanylyltransferase
VSLVVLLGGARSGKSTLAVRLAAESGAPVTYLATGEARDEEMAVRIAAHRAERPPQWTTIEEPHELAAAIAAVDPGATLVVDCLSLWVANRLDRVAAEEIEAESTAAAGAAAARCALTIAVSNEVGLGVVPATPLGRSYRDVLGRVNASWVERSERATFVVAGRAVPLEAWQ